MAAIDYALPCKQVSGGLISGNFCADLSAAAMGSDQAGAAMHGSNQRVELAGMYSSRGHPSLLHQQWCALLSLTGHHAAAPYLLM